MTFPDAERILSGFFIIPLITQSLALCHDGESKGIPRGNRYILRLLCDRKPSPLGSDVLENDGNIVFNVPAVQRVNAVAVYIVGFIAPCAFPVGIVIRFVIEFAEEGWIACVERAFFKNIDNAYIVHTAAGDKRVVQLLLVVASTVRLCHQIDSVPEYFVVDQKVMLSIGILIPHDQKELLHASHDGGEVERFYAVGRLVGNFPYGNAPVKIVQSALRDDDVGLKIRHIS